MQIRNDERSQIENAHARQKDTAPREEKQHYEARLIFLVHRHAMSFQHGLIPSAVQRSFPPIPSLLRANWSQNRVPPTVVCGQMYFHPACGAASTSSTRRTAALSTRGADKSP